MNRLLFLLFILQLLPANSQDFRVDYIFGNNRTVEIAVSNTDVWVGSEIGLTRINKSDLSTTAIVDPLVDYGACFWPQLETDQNGNVFFHTADNLFTYRNGKVQHIESSDLYSAFYIDDNNTMWILKYSTQPELTKVSNGVKTIFTPSNSGLPDKPYSCIAAKDGVVWLGTSADGLVKFSNNLFEEYDSGNSGLPHNYISSLTIDESNDLWITCFEPGGFYSLVKYSGGNWTNYNSQNSTLPNARFYKVVANDGKIYMCTNDGLYILNGANWSVINTSLNAILSDDIRSVQPDGYDLWIGTIEGLSLIRNGTTSNFELANSPLSGSFQGPIAEDKDGNIWVGTSGTFGNLCKFDGTQWTEVISAGTSINPNSIYSVAVDTNNVVWATDYAFGTQGGVHKIENGTITLYNETNSILPSFPKEIIVDKFNNKWITTSSKVFKFDDVNWTVFDNSDFPEIYNPHSIASDNDGNIWMGVNQSGMVKFDGTNWIHYDETFFGDGYPEVNNIVFDSAGDLWFNYSNASQDPKIGKFDGTSVTWYASNSVLSEAGELLTIEENGDMWFSNSEGLSHYDWNNWKHYTPNTSRLLNNQVWQFLIDENNDKWISAGSYLARFNEEDIYTPIPDDTYSESIIYPNPSEGIFQIQVSDVFSSNVTVTIFSMNGTKIGTYTIDPDYAFELDLTPYAQGMYIIRLESEEIREIHKVIKP